MKLYTTCSENSNGIFDRKICPREKASPPKRIHIVKRSPNNKIVQVIILNHNTF